MMSFDLVKIEIDSIIEMSMIAYVYNFVQIFKQHIFYCLNDKNNYWYVIKIDRFISNSKGMKCFCNIMLQC